MTIFNLGSVNIDHVYTLPRFPEPGQTLTSTSYSRGLGGKGMNQSVAAAKAGAPVFHIGAMGSDDGWVRESIVSYGVDCTHLRELSPPTPTGHAIIYLVEAENSIVIEPGANGLQDPDAIASALSHAGPGDTLLLQNETSYQVFAAKLASEKGLRVIYSAAPFDKDAVEAVLPHISMLVMNEGEANDLCSALGVSLDQIPVPELIVTLGDEGAMWRSNETGEEIKVTSYKVTPVDTTGAGDTFIGYVAAGLDLGKSVSEALDWASKAAALKVTRHGAADAIPTADEVATAFTD